MARAWIVIAVLLLLAGCVPSAPSGPPKPPPGFVTREAFGDKWPLTVESGQLACKIIEAGSYRLPALTFTHGGIVYQLNGVAKAHVPGKEIDAIWAAPEPNWITLKSGEKVNTSPPKKVITPIFEVAQGLCPK